jgi:cation:H+ antiporter
MLEYFLFILGFIILIKCVNYLVDGSSLLAKRSGISPLIIGLTIVAIGTSLPELVISLFSILKGNTEFVFGTILGSNISNILLIIGLSAIVFPVVFNKSIINNEIPLGLFASVLLFILAFGSPGYISRIDGIIMLAIFAFFVYYIYKIRKKDKKKTKVKIKQYNDFLIALMIIGGLIGLFIGGKLIVDNALLIANNFGISDFLISATIIAIGTSLPELATALVAIFKKKVDLAIGTIAGSNIINIFLILGLTSVISPIRIPIFAGFDMIYLIFASLILLAFIFLGKNYKLTKISGFFLLLFYILYLIIIIFRG